MTRAAKAIGTTTRSRREEILAVAAIVIAERGISGATVRDIGTAAGILSGSLYHHFDSKEQIVLELMMPLVEETHAELITIRDRAAGPAEALDGMISAAVHTSARRPSESLILRNETNSFAELPALAPIAAARRTSLEMWISVVTRGIDDGYFRSDVDADVVVRAIFDAVLGSARWFGEPNPANPDPVAASLTALFLDGLRRR